MKSYVHGAGRSACCRCCAIPSRRLLLGAAQLWLTATGLPPASREGMTCSREYCGRAGRRGRGGRRVFRGSTHSWHEHACIRHPSAPLSPPCPALQTLPPLPQPKPHASIALALSSKFLRGLTMLGWFSVSSCRGGRGAGSKGRHAAVRHNAAGRGRAAWKQAAGAGRARSVRAAARAACRAACMPAGRRPRRA